MKTTIWEKFTSQLESQPLRRPYRWLSRTLNAW